MRLFLPWIVSACLACGGMAMTNTAAIVETADITDANYIIARISGQWQALGAGMGGVAGGKVVNAIVRAPGGAVYAGGYFTTAGGVTVNNVARWTGAAWEALGATAGTDGAVYALAIQADGKLVVGGNFTHAGGVACNYIALYDPVANTWAALGTGFNLVCFALAIDPDTGYIYAGGTFTTADGGAAAYVAKWNGAAWAALDAGCDSYVYDLKWADGQLYMAGDFTTINAVTVNYVGIWNGTTGVTMAGGANTVVNKVARDAAGQWYAVGDFTTIGGISANYIAKWNGSSWAALDVGLNATAYGLDATGKDVYIGGNFSQAGGYTLPNRVALWNGTRFSHLSITLPGSAIVKGMLQYNDDVYLGFDTAGTAIASGINTVTVTSTGTARMYPWFTIRRAGGTTAVLQSIQNLTTTEKLLFNYILADGEELVIDCTATRKAMRSTFNPYPLNSMLPYSDFTQFHLAPGANIVALFISTSGAPTLSVFMQWDDAFLSADGALA